VLVVGGSENLVADVLWILAGDFPHAVHEQNVDATSLHQLLLEESERRGAMRTVA